MYLYREEITFACEKYRWLLLVVCLAVSVAWYLNSIFSENALLLWNVVALLPLAFLCNRIG